MALDYIESYRRAYAEAKARAEINAQKELRVEQEELMRGLFVEIELVPALKRAEKEARKAR